MNFRITSSLEKCFQDGHSWELPEIKAFSMLKNERYSLQVCYDSDTPVNAHVCVVVSVESPLADCIRLYRVRSIPSEMPVYKEWVDDNYLRTEPGLYPDLLEPLPAGYRLKLNNCLNAVWAEIDPAGKYPAGKYPVTFSFTDGSTVCKVTAEAEIIDAELPPQETIVTQWFYADCLMNYYRTGRYDERHWKAIESFMANAARYGQNMILTPVLSPELDTFPGLYRNQTQLADVFVNGGEYSFSFERLGRWVDLCDKTGIRYLEINHFFSQWGAASCPQVWATVDGEYRRIFGWENASDCPEYKDFLGHLIPAMMKYLREEKIGADKRCWFHISDEPGMAHIDQYTKVRNIVEPLIEGRPIMDALSSYEFYQLGLVNCPVPSNDHIEEFLEHQVPDLWTYYCCGQCVDVSNRFFAMPSARTRIIGLQFYKYRIAGFLQWGYNFYNTQLSFAELNPFLCSDGECFSPSGDAFSVYPGTDETAWPSLREVVFFEGLQDVRALQLLEQLAGREEAMRILEDGIEPITFKKYPHEAAFLLDLRERINHRIKELKQ